MGARTQHKPIWLPLLLSFHLVSATRSIEQQLGANIPEPDSLGIKILTLPPSSNIILGKSLISHYLSIFICLIGMKIKFLCHRCLVIYCYIINHQMQWFKTAAITLSHDFYVSSVHERLCWTALSQCLCWDCGGQTVVEAGTGGGKMKQLEMARTSILCSLWASSCCLSR